MSQDDFADWIYAQNETISSMKAAYILKDTRKPNVGGGNVDEIFAEVDDICIILMDHLVASSEQLEKSGYYDNYSEEEKSVLRERQEKLHAWKRQQTHINQASPFDEEEGYETTH